MNRKFSFAKMASYRQPYNELGSAMVRVLALYREVQGFDSGGIHVWHDIAIMTSKPISIRNCLLQAFCIVLKIFAACLSFLARASRLTELHVG